MSVKLLNDEDYVLAEGCGWFEVGGFAVRIYHDNDLLRVSVCKAGDEMVDYGELEIPNDVLEDDDA